MIKISQQIKIESDKKAIQKTVGNQILNHVKLSEFYIKYETKQVKIFYFYSVF